MYARDGAGVRRWITCTTRRQAEDVLSERLRESRQPVRPAVDTTIVFVRLLKRAELPPHFSPHCLRHTFATLLLQQGESPVYVQRQLGHASIKLTVDTYGKWLPMGNKAAVDRLDDAPAGASGSKADPGGGGCGGSPRKIW
jgi:integrase